VLPQAPEGVNVCTTCDQHGEAEELWCGQARDAAQCRTPSAQRPQQPHRKLLPTDAATRAAHARRQVPRTGPTLPRGVWTKRAPLPTGVASVVCAYIPSGNAAKIADVD
jgi:hypothetical protein